MKAAPSIDLHYSNQQLHVYKKNSHVYRCKHPYVYTTEALKMTKLKALTKAHPHNTHIQRNRHTLSVKSNND